jgi:ATP-binding cassette subfamily C protein LapB
MIEYLLPLRLRTVNTLQDASLGKDLLAAFSNARQKISKAALISVPISLFALLPSVFALIVFDRVIHRQGVSTLIALLAGIAVTILIEWYFRRLRAEKLREAGALLDWTLSSTLLERMLGQPLKALEERAAASWMALFRDVGAVRGLLTGSVVQATFDLPVAIFSLIIIALVATPVLPVVLIALFVFSALAWWWADEIKSGKVTEIHQARNLDVLTSEICRARESVKSLDQKNAVVSQWKQQYEQWLGESFQKSTQLENARELSHGLLISTTISITAFGALAVVNQWMTVGGLIAANMLALKAISPVATLAGSWRQLALSREASRRLLAVYEQKLEREDGEVSIPRPAGRIQLDKVSYGYHKDADPLLQEVSLALEPKGFYAICGKNGVGKSTLLKLISGLYQPDSGTALMDGYDLKQFSRAQLSGWIGNLAQQVYMLDGSIAEQMRRVCPTATDEQIVRACQLSGAHNFISKLPDGYSTQLTEGARSLSAGERRKISLAQVLLRNPCILVLDEPSNDLDHESEMQLIAALKSIAQFRSVIVVTHSARMVANTDAVVSISGDRKIELLTTEEGLLKHFGVGSAQHKTKKPSPVALVA